MGIKKTKEIRSFTTKEISAIQEAYIVSTSQKDKAVMFNLKSGGQTFLPLFADSNLGVGEYLNLQSAKLITISEEGESDVVFVRES